MKYESDILKRLIDTYGVVGNPRYISEIIKEFIVRGKELFPELFTYQSDWLAHIDEFGLNPTYTVSYTGQSIYAPNTLERPVTSAILKGNTLVNLSDNLETITRSLNGWYVQEKLMDNIEKIKRNTYYTILYRLENISGNHQDYNGISLGIGMNAFNKDLTDNIISIVDKNGGWCKVRFQLTDDFIEQFPTYKQLYIRPIRRTTAPVEGESIDYTIKGFTILEGDYITNPIPFNEVFEGMQSVKMPVLTTIGKNLFGLCEFEKGTMGGFPNTNITITNNSISFGEIGGSVVVKLKGKPNTKYTISFIVNNTSTMNLREWNDRTQTTDVNGEVIWRYGSYNPNTNNGLYKLENIQIEEGSVATSYEPYKTNILTVNEEVELRGIGVGSNRIEDELDCLTGEVVERIGEIVLDGTQDMSSDDNGVYIQVNDVKRFLDYTGKIACDKLPVVSTYGQLANVENGISGYTNSGSYLGQNWLYVRINNSVNKDEVKEWLTQNPITVQYQLANESVKTVDLTILDQNGQGVDHLKSFNGGTHIYTSSLEGSLTPSVDISVVTNLEETLKLCSLDGNTL